MVVVCTCSCGDMTGVIQSTQLADVLNLKIFNRMLTPVREYLNRLAIATRNKVNFFVL